CTNGAIRLRAFQTSFCETVYSPALKTVLSIYNTACIQIHYCCQGQYSYTDREDIFSNIKSGRMKHPIFQIIRITPQKKHSTWDLICHIGKIFPTQAKWHIMLDKIRI